MSTQGAGRRRTTVQRLLEMKAEGQKIVALTAYDVLFARIVDDIGVDVVLVGDSLGQAVLGYDTSLAVTLDDMIRHGRAVRRGVRSALLVVDMPFLSFQVSPEDTLRNAARLMAETGADAVKLEGGSARIAAHAARLIDAGIPVMGHVTVTPQSAHADARGDDDANADRIRAEAGRLAEAGCFGIVLVRVPTALAADLTRGSPVPTIGIGAGPDCDGQVLLLPQALGLDDGPAPPFLRRFADLAGEARRGVADYVTSVRRGQYPGPAQASG